MTRTFRYWLQNWFFLEAAWLVFGGGSPAQAGESLLLDGLKLNMTASLESGTRKAEVPVFSASFIGAPVLKLAGGLEDIPPPVTRANEALPPQQEKGPPSSAPNPPKPERDEGRKWRLAPMRLRWNGGMSTAITVHGGDNSKSSTQKVDALTLNGQANSFIWQPWFAQVNANLGLNLVQSDSDGAKTHSLSLTGAGRVNFLPRSRFPLDTFLDATDSRVSGDSLGSEYRRVRFGARQNYRPLTHMGNYSGGYERTVQSSFGLADETTDIIDFRAFRGFGDKQSVNADGTLTLSDRGNEKLQLLNLRGDHFWRPEDNLSLQSDASLVSSKVDTSGAADFRSHFVQMGSFANWSSLEMPLHVTGGVRFSGSLVESGLTRSDTKSINANLGATYEYSRNLRFTGSAGLNVNDAQTTTSQGVGVSYGSDSEPVFGGAFQYQKAASANLSNQTGDNNSSQTVSGAASHSLTRSLPEIYGGNLYMNFNQGLSAVRTSGAGSNPVSQPSGAALIDATNRVSSTTSRLTHGANFQWGRFWESAQISAGLNATDSRGLEQDAGAFQLVNLNINGNRRLSVSSSLTGTLSMQASRQEAENQGSGQSTLSTNASTSYQNTRMFGVPRLDFNSYVYATMTQSSSDSGGVSQSNRVDLRWDNRFKYFLGKSELQLRSEVAETGGQRRFLLFFYVNRYLN